MVSNINSVFKSVRYVGKTKTKVLVFKLSISYNAIIKNLMFLTVLMEPKTLKNVNNCWNFSKLDFTLGISVSQNSNLNLILANFLIF
jgi:hypothetical protein